MPLGLSVVDDDGRTQDLNGWFDVPSVLVLADYTCKTLCSPVLSMVAGSLERSGLQAGSQYKLIVLGLDPNDGIAAARKARSERLGNDSTLGKAALFATGDDATVEHVTRALGYRYQLDRDDDQFIHPAAAFVLRPGGGVSRVLTGLGIDPADMRLAIVEAGEGKVGTLSDQVRLLCSSFDPAHGIYNVAVARLLWAVGALTILSLGGLIGVLALGGRRRAV
jgi:protein SCO1/2